MTAIRVFADPGLFAAELQPLSRRSWVVVDEVQRLPSLLNEVQRFIEDRGLRFALLGSSARKLRAAGVNLLAGRALWRDMFPLTPEELGAQFDLDRALETGSLPLVLASDRQEETLRTYVQRMGSTSGRWRGSSRPCSTAISGGELRSGMPPTGCSRGAPRYCSRAGWWRARTAGL